MDPLASRLPSALGPGCVGTRVVVRRVLRGETGPSGGPRMTDLLGVMESWGGEVTTIRAEDGTLVEIALADIVSGKPVPPKASVRLRVTPEEAQRRAASVGDDPAGAVRGVVGSPEELRLVAEGWVAGEEVLFQLCGVAAAVRATGTAGPSAGPERGPTLDGVDGSWVRVPAPQSAEGFAAALRWGAERGATTAYVELAASDETAHRLTAELGFVTHHTYRVWSRR